MALTRSGWLAALDAEIKLQASELRGAVAEVRTTPAGLWQITLSKTGLQRDGQDRAPPPSEDLVGCAIRQQPAGRWSGKVVGVDPDRAEITVDVEEGEDPVPQQRFSIQPPVYLLQLRQWLATDGAGLDPEALLRARLDAVVPTLPPWPLPDTLRAAQRRAMEAARRPFLVVWGPPGTGKTFTLAAILAAHVQAGRRILALTPTRVAADALTTLVDDALLALQIPRKKGMVLRTDLPETYEAWRESRPHLLAWADVDAKRRGLVGETVEKLRKVDRRLADASLTAEARAALTDKKAHLRARLDNIATQYREKQSSLVNAASIVIATTRQAVSRGWNEGFPILAVDEAGMVSLSDACWALASGADHVVFAGDHRQLGPIVQAKKGADPPLASLLQRWLGTSLLEHLDEGTDPPWRVLLDEQSRMNAELCAYVSNTFYGGRLRAVQAPPPGIPGEIARGVGLIPAASEPDPDLPPIGGKNVHPEGATTILHLARRLAGRHTVLAMSCYADQARLLRRALGDLIDRGVRAGTVHRMQGQEADVALYDPVDPTGWFPMDSEDAPRLTNVAASRARRAFLVVGSEHAVRRNPHLAGVLPADAPAPRKRGVLRYLVDED